MRAGGLQTLTNADIATAFDELADLLEIGGANAFRVRAYRAAARAIETFPRSLAEMHDAKEDLRQVPGVGVDLAGKIAELAATGRLRALGEARKSVGAGLAELLRLPGLGPKRVRALRDELGVRDLAGLQRALGSGRIRGLRGFGEKTEARIRQGIEDAAAPKRHRLDVAEPVARSIAARLREEGGARQVEVAGSFRRHKETVGDLDLVATGPRAARIMDALATHPDVVRVLSKGATRSTVLTRSGLQVDVRVVRPGSFGAALHYFTGSKEHNIALRRRGQTRGLKVNEYGVFRGARRIAGRTEDSVYASLGLPFIPPELRENQGEIEAAEAGALPRLLEIADVKGDLQAHTTDSDGRSTLEEMAAAAQEIGLEYLAITDHSPHPAVAKGLDAKRLRAQGHRIDALNARLEGLTLLKGVEVDIRRDGALDLPDEALEGLDLVVASVHDGFDLPADEQTERVLRAMSNPLVHVLGHPTGRILGERKGIRLDVERLLADAGARRWCVEANAQPERLDLADAHLRRAKAHGVLVSLGTDAHHASHLGLMRYGVRQARRGWLGPEDTLNARPLRALRRLLARRR